MLSRRRTEDALREEMRSLETLLRVGQAVAAELDVERVIQIVIEAGKELSGAAFGLYAPTYPGDAVIRSGDVTSDQRITDLPHLVVENGRPSVRSYLAVPVRSRSGEVFGGLFFGHPEPDVFGERAERLVLGMAAQAAIALDNARLFLSLKQSQQELQEADRRKDAFLATLAHELRNPLAPLRHGLQIMQLASHDKKAIEDARTMMKRQLQHMVRLIDDLLDVSRITLGKIELRCERVELADVVRRAVEASQPMVAEAGHELEVTLADDLMPLEADVVRLAQVFVNLLDNAAKYTRKGGRITITAHRDDRTAIVRVADTGRGIEPAMLTRVFDMFAQIDDAADTPNAGLGIGLGIARQLIELHGGSIEGRSAGAGRGSEFVVRLPIAARPTPQPARAADLAGALASPRRRVLVADDNTDSASSLTMMLSLAGHDVRTAFDGAHALEIADEFRPDIALLDVGMPKLNGYDLCRRLRERPWGRAMLVVALTGWDQPAHRAAADAAGFDHHVVKPAEPDTLERLLAVSASHHPTATPRT